MIDAKRQRESLAALLRIRALDHLCPGGPCEPRSVVAAVVRDDQHAVARRELGLHPGDACADPSFFVVRGNHHYDGDAFRPHELLPGRKKEAREALHKEDQRRDRKDRGGYSCEDRQQDHDIYYSQTLGMTHIPNLRPPGRSNWPGETLASMSWLNGRAGEAGRHESMMSSVLAAPWMRGDG